MIVRALATAFFLAIAVAQPARGDEPPSWQPFERCAANERFCAHVKRIECTSASPCEQRYVLRVIDGDGSAVWSSPYNYDGYPGGYLSNDGAYFVYVNFWYHPSDPVVSIYSRKGRRSLPGSVFSIREKDLVRTVSHRVWLNQGREPVQFIDVERLSIATVDGRTHTIHLPTGGISAK